MTISLPTIEFGAEHPLSEQLPFQGENDGTPDFRLVFGKFPVDPTSSKIQSTSKPPFNLRDFGTIPVVRYSRVSLDALARVWLKKLADVFLELPHERQRVEAIAEKLAAGATWFPPFLQWGDPYFRALEGNHRCVAYITMFPKVKTIPAYLVGYGDWFNDRPNQFASSEYLATLWPHGEDANDDAYTAQSFDDTAGRAN